MLIELKATAEQHVGALAAKLANLEKQIEALQLVADPLNRKIKKLEHVRHFLRDALQAETKLISASNTELLADSDIPF